MVYMSYFRVIAYLALILLLLNYGYTKKTKKLKSAVKVKPVEKQTKKVSSDRAKNGGSKGPFGSPTNFPFPLSIPFPVIPNKPVNQGNVNAGGGQTQGQGAQGGQNAVPKKKRKKDKQRAEKNRKRKESDSDYVNKRKTKDKSINKIKSKGRFKRTIVEPSDVLDVEALRNIVRRHSRSIEDERELSEDDIKAREAWLSLDERNNVPDVERVAYYPTTELDFIMKGQTDLLNAMDTIIPDFRQKRSLRNEREINRIKRSDEKEDTLFVKQYLKDFNNNVDILTGNRRMVTRDVNPEDDEHSDTYSDANTERRMVTRDISEDKFNEDIDDAIYNIVHGDEVDNFEDDDDVHFMDTRDANEGRS